MQDALQILAGRRALETLRERGLHADDIGIVAGASGGPKWLVLAGLDRVLFGGFLTAPRERPLHLIGSSVGSWRMACLAQRDPVAAIERFETAYIEQQRYSPRPSPREVSAVGNRLLDALLGPDGADQILQNETRRLHVVTVRARGLAASERRLPQLASFGFAALANMISRRTLAWQFERVIFDNAGDDSPFRHFDDFPTRHVPLTGENLRPALMASGSIPMVLEGVRIPGARRGVYRDGGVIDYHLDIDYGRGAGLVLYPHFYPHIVPGWFDKPLPWRTPSPRNFDRVVLLAPTDAFVASLPGGRIPDRKDFHRYDEAERVRLWRRVVDASRRLGEAFAELNATGRWAEHVRPLVFGRARRGA